MKDTILSKLESLLKSKLSYDHDGEIRKYQEAYHQVMRQQNVVELYREIVSGYNRFIRGNEWSCSNFNIDVKVGDICYVDFGHSYINEIAFQHCALVVSIFNYKAFVVPMTSNLKAMSQAKNVSEDGKDHLFYIGQVPGLNKPSVIFLNDAQYINTARIISKSARIEPGSLLFLQIVANLKRCIFEQNNL